MRKLFDAAEKRENECLIGNRILFNPPFTVLCEFHTNISRHITTSLCKYDYLLFINLIHTHESFVLTYLYINMKILTKPIIIWYLVQTFLIFVGILNKITRRNICESLHPLEIDICDHKPKQPKKFSIHMINI